MQTQLTPMEIMLQRQVSELQQQTELMRQLGTTDGFYHAYFKLLGTARTNEEAFNTLNDQYFDLYGEYRYIDYDSFRKFNYRRQIKKPIK